VICLTPKASHGDVFEGGFDLTKKNPNGTTGCKRSHTSTVTSVAKADYIPPSTNLSSTTHPLLIQSTLALPLPGRLAFRATLLITSTTPMTSSPQSGLATSLQLSFLKAPGYQDAHAGYSDPLDEQEFVVNTIISCSSGPSGHRPPSSLLMTIPTAGMTISLGQIVNQSSTAADALNGPGQCGSGLESALAGVSGTHAQGRCGYGPRLPLQVISPYARVNYVDHTLTDQTSVLRFIEDNWLKGERIGGGSFERAGWHVEQHVLLPLANQRNPHAARSFNRFDVKLTALKNIAGGSKNNRSGCPRFRS